MTLPPAIVRTPPHSLEAEQGILGCILLDPAENMEHCIETLRRGHEIFYDLRHQALYQHMAALHETNRNFDLVTLAQRLKDQNQLEACGGIAYLATLADTVPSAANLKYYLDIAIEKHLLRETIKACTGTLAQAYEPDSTSELLLENADKALQRVRDGGSAAPTAHDARAAMGLLIDDLERRHQLKGARSGLVTGFFDFDQMTDGLQRKEMIVIGARPSIGKTAIGLNMVQRICLEDKIPTLIISLEMSTEALMRRMLSAKTRIPMNTLKTGQFMQDEFDAFTRFQLHVQKCPLHIMDDTFDITRICASARRLCRKHGIQFILLDYLQKAHASRRQEKRTYEVGEVSSALKELAKTTNTAVVTLAQLNRESERDKGRSPRLADLGDSGQIERDADVVGLLHRDRNGDNPNKATLIVAKQRDGETGLVHLRYDPQYCQFAQPDEA